MAPSWLSLEEDEQIKHLRHPSLWTIFPSIISSAFSLIIVLGILLFASNGDSWPLPIPVWVFVLLLISLSIVLPIIQEVKRRSVYYIVTDKQIIKKRGIISLEDNPIPHTQIVDYKVEQSPVDKLVGKGNLYIATAGSDGFEVEYLDLPNPQALKSSISTYTKG